MSQKAIVFVLEEYQKRYQAEVDKVAMELAKAYYEPVVVHQMDQNLMDIKNLKLIISIGGDGTILRAAALSMELSLPILGVSCGRLGFLAEIPLRDLHKALQRIGKKQYFYDKRNFLEIKHGRYKDFALNEVAIHSMNTTMIECEVHLNKAYLTSYRADGLIVATSTGSTAYNLSAGGPIIFPDTEVMIITPICSHSLTVRPLVISAKDVLNIQPIKSDVSISVDGKPGQAIERERIKVSFSERSVIFIRFKPDSFIDGLRDKLNWSGKIS